VTETSASVPDAERRCPWCSSVTPEGAERCPSCGAALHETASGAEADIPGVTQVDPVLGARRRLPRPNRLVGWLADVDTEPASTAELDPRPAAGGRPGFEGLDAASVAPPSDEVRREMRRLELEALTAELERRAAEARLTAMESGQVPSGSDVSGPPPPEAPPIAPPPDSEGAAAG
jgi:hypothetical protein